jgi:hypothetical protein
MVLSLPVSHGRSHARQSCHPQKKRSARPAFLAPRTILHRRFSSWRTECLGCKFMNGQLSRLMKHEHISKTETLQWRQNTGDMTPKEGVKIQ